MRKIVSVALASTAALALSACGTAEDASADAEAENVEMTADDAVEGVEEAPVEDAMAAGGEAAAEEAAAEETSEAVAEEADTAASEAEAAAADAVAAAEGTARNEANKMIDKAADAAKKELGN